MFFICEVTDPYSTAGDFVFVSGADAALGGPNFNAVHTVLSNTVKLGMDREDKRGRFGNQQIVRIDFNALFFDALDFGEKGPRV